MTCWHRKEFVNQSLSRKYMNYVDLLFQRNSGSELHC